LAAISTGWYTAVEMAKDNRVSMQMIESVACALRLNAVELRHLYVLSGASRRVVTRTRALAR
jgi:hypothetical protein